MKKPIITFILLTALTLTLAACGAQPAPTLTAADCLDLGEKYLLDLDYEQAIVQFNKAITIEPKLVEAYIGLSEAHIRLGQAQESASSLIAGYNETLDVRLAAKMEDIYLYLLELGDQELMEAFEKAIEAGGVAALTDRLAELKSSLEPEQEAATVGETIEFGGYEWRVLDVQDGKALLLSEDIIERRAYHSTQTEVTWEGCDLRKYLNGEFYNRFSAEDRERIAETQVVNNDNPWFGTNGGNDTNDKIFLLSLEEVVRYFGDSGKLRSRPGDDWIFDDEYNKARIAYFNSTASLWWLRSPSYHSYYGAHVSSAGSVSVGTMGFVDEDGHSIDIFDGGIRPALWLNL